MTPRALAERPAFLVALVLLAAAIIRLRTLGDVAAHGDEQFYLIVGDRMLNHGAVPYLDIWDRKPVGLFLIFTAIRTLGGDGIVAYQIVATLVAGATAALIGHWAQRVAGLWPALLAAVFYLLTLQTHLGFGGQAEVFLNLFIVGAAWLVHSAVTQSPGERALLGRGAAAMALMGVALQIKPTALFPGLWFGLALVWAAWRAGLPLARIAVCAALWAFVALLPTLAVVGWYAAADHLDAWLFANVTSIADKKSGGAAGELARTLGVALRLGVAYAAAIGLLAIEAYRHPPSNERRTALLFLLGWFAASVVAYFVLPAAYPHYALILAPVGCILVGQAAGIRRLGWLIVAGALLLCGRLMLNDRERVANAAHISPQVRAMAARIDPELGSGCLYVYHGPLILYRLTDNCIPTRFAFPNHLSIAPEASALGVDSVVEVARILKTRPPVIVTGSFSFHKPNQATRALVERRVARDYEPIALIRDRQGDVFATAHRLKR